MKHAHRTLLGITLAATAVLSLYPPWKLRGGMSAGYFLLWFSGTTLPTEASITGLCNLSGWS